MLLKIINYIREHKFRYNLSHSNVRCSNTAILKVGKNVKIEDSFVYVMDGASLTIGNNVTLKHIYMTVKGHVKIGEFTKITGEDYVSNAIYEIDNGCVTVGHHSLLRCRRLWTRFGGEMVIGDYTNINRESELRADEKVTIGDYCQVSYHVNVWDTNTHCIYSPDERIEHTRKYWPSFGKEIEKPDTKPVYIGNNVWIGEQANIMKGTSLGDNVIVGFGTTLFNKKIEVGSKVVTDILLKEYN